MASLEFKLSVFEGPLDLLLHLVQKHKIDLSDIPIGLITEQYLAYLEKMTQMDMEVTAEFLAMASHLLYIKSRALLPIQEEEEDPREEIADRIRLYQEAKEAAQKLEERQFSTIDNYFKLPERLPDVPIENDRIPVDLLVKTFMLLEERLEEKAPPPLSAFREIVHVPQVSLSEKIQHVRLMFQKKKRQVLTDVFHGITTKNELIATFLAVLHLVSHGELCIEEQEEEIILLGGKGHDREA